MISRCPRSGYGGTQRQLISCKDNLFSHNTQIFAKIFRISEEIPRTLIQQTTIDLIARKSV